MAKAELKSAANEVRQKRLACEALLRQLAESERFPSSDELFELQSYGLGDPQQLQREVARLKRRISLEQQAGSKSDREQMQQHVAQCEALLKSEAPKLEAAIAHAQKELSRLQKDARISQQRLEQMNLAAARLKDTLPESVRQEFQQRRSMIDSTLFRAMLDSETRINEIRVLLESPSEPLSNAARLWVEQWRRRYPGAFSDDGTGRGRWLATPEFSERCNELKAELELLTAKHEQQKAEFEKAVAELDAEMEAIANG